MVFHAAAYKHVPMLQAQLRETIRNNTVGTMVAARAPRRALQQRLAAARALGVLLRLHLLTTAEEPALSRAPRGR